MSSPTNHSTVRPERWSRLTWVMAWTTSWTLDPMAGRSTFHSSNATRPNDSRARITLPTTPERAGDVRCGSCCDTGSVSFTLVAFHAHPDDEALLSGGTLA